MNDDSTPHFTVARGNKGGGWVILGGTGVVSPVAVYIFWQTPHNVSSLPSCVQHEGRLETLRGTQRVWLATGFLKLHITSHLHSLRLYSWNVIMKPLCIFYKRRQGTLYISIYIMGNSSELGGGGCRSSRKTYNNTCLSILVCTCLCYLNFWRYPSILLFTKILILENLLSVYLYL